MGKHGFAGFSVREMQLIAWRTNGINNTAIARRLGLERRYVSTLMSRIYRKAGVHDLSMLTRWAIKNGMDEALRPETEETREIVQ